MREFFKNMFSRLTHRKIGMGILALQLIASGALLYLVCRLQMLKTWQIGALTGALLILFILMLFIHAAESKLHIAGKVISIILIIVYGIAGYICMDARGSLAGMTGNNTQIENVGVYVLQENEATTINDIEDGTFAVFSLSTSTKVTDTINTINEHLGKEIVTKEYSDAVTAAKALYDKEVDAIIMDDSYVDVIEDAEYDTFEDDTKVLQSYEHTTETQNVNAVSDVTENAFSVFISGIDTYGDVSKKSRSDVNIIATINPVTKQILLTSTPRDYYVETTVSNGMKDKLTHAGLYGVDCSVGTLETLYNTEINYYVKVNFSGFEDIVDALGGVTVHSDYTFTSEQGPAFVEGDNDMNGEEALAFVRERHSFAAGDLQRNKNQQYLLAGIIDKVTSPSILTNFSSLLSSVEKNMTTNLEYNDIAALVQMQLSDNASWEVIMVGLSGEGSRQVTYSNQSKSGYVMYPDETMVQNATMLINQVLEGKVFTQEEATAALKATEVLTSTDSLVSDDETEEEATATPASTN